MSLRGRWLAMLVAASLVTAPAGAALGAPDSGSDALTDKARELHREGEALFKKKDYARARAAFLAAWSLKQHWTTAGNLGDCELKLGLYRDAAEHLAIYLRALEREKQPVPDKAMARFRDALSHVGAIDVRVKPQGAEVLVNGKPAGTSPLDGPVFVDPGQHTIEVRLAARTARLPVELKAGESREVYFDVTPGTGAADEAAGAEDAGPAGETAAAAPEAASPGGKLPAWYEPSGGLGAAGNTPPVPETVAPLGGGEHPKAVFIAGGAIAGAAAVGTGVALALLSGGKASDADALLAELRRDGVHCSRPPQPGGCTELLSLREDHDLLMNAAKVTLVSGAVLWVATAAYTFWPRSTAQPTTAQPTTAIWAMPLASPHSGGLWIGGRF